MSALLILIAVIACFGLFYASTYNKLVRAKNQIEEAGAAIDAELKKRYDLVPNLVETVKGYAKHEQETLEGVIEARANATKVTIDPTNMTPEDLQKYQAAQGDVTNALSRLIAVAENYPDLKANQNFLELQSQLEGTENRIAVERNKFNEVARQYNTKRRTFPTNIIAGIFGFGDKPYFQAQEGADKAPKVDFGTSEGK